MSTNVFRHCIVILTAAVACVPISSAVLARAGDAAAPQISPDQLDFFEKKIRPLLVGKCVECHSAENNKVKGGLALDSVAGLLKGGDSGPAVVPGKPAESLLIKVIRHADPDLKMVYPDGLNGVKFDEMSAPPLRGLGLDRELLMDLYACNAERVVEQWWGNHGGL